MKKCTLLLFAIHLSILSATAIADDSPLELMLFEEVPVVFSASKIEEPITEAPAAMSVITGTQLREWGITNIADAFRFIPGVDVTAYNGREWGVTARGFNERFARRMLVLIDGMSVYTPFVSGVEWGSLPILIDDIDTIEVIRGPNDTLYGFNAFNGVINIKTKAPEQTQGIFAKYTFGTQHYDEAVGRFGGEVKSAEYGDLAYRVSYNLLDTQGYGDKNGREAMDNRHTHIVNARTTYTPTDQLAAEFHFGINAGKNGQEPRISGGATYPKDIDFDYQLAKLTFKYNSHHTFELQGYRWKVSQDGKYLSSGLAVNDSKESQYDVSLQDTISFLDGRSTTVIGTQYRYDRVRSLLVRRNTTTNTMQTTGNTSSSTFVNEKFVLVEGKPYVEKLTLVGGIRLESTKLLDDFEWAPRISLLYAPVKNNVFRATFARAFRIPSFMEEYGTHFVPADTGAAMQILGNRNVKRESVNSYEIGYSGVYGGGRFTLDVDAFIADYSGLMQTYEYQTGPPSMHLVVNSTDAESVGVECEVSGKITSWMQTNATYTFERIYSRNDPAHSVTTQFDSMTPKHKCTLGVTVKTPAALGEDVPWLKDITCAANLQYRDHYENIKPHTRCDFRIAKSFFNKGFEIAFIGQNVFGNGNYEATYVAVPRTFLGTVTIEKFPWEWLGDEA